MRYFLPISVILMSSLMAQNQYRQSANPQLEEGSDLYLSLNEFQDQAIDDMEDFLDDEQLYPDYQQNISYDEYEFESESASSNQNKKNSSQSKKTQQSHPRVVQKSASNANKKHANVGYAQSRSRGNQSTLVAQSKDNTANQSSQQDSSAPTIFSNTATRPVVKNGYNFWFMGDVLLWQATEENLTYIYKGNNTNGQTNRTLHTVDFDWDWGFRLGAGYNIPRDGWDIDLIWTHIRNNGSGHQSGPEDNPALNPNNKGLFQVWVPASSVGPGSIVKASGHWHLHLDQLDLGLGRSFYVGKHLTLRPFFGMRSTWIFQELKVNMLSDTTSTGGGIAKKDAKMKNKFWGFGFAAGLGSDWLFGKGFSLFGDIDIATLLGLFDIDQRGTLNGAHLWDIDKSFRVGRCIVDLDLGIKWFKLFCKDRFGLTLKAAYEYHLYFDQNQFLLSSGSTNLEIWNPVNGNLIYQGVSGSIQFDF